jgi:hypothetical protein
MKGGFCLLRRFCTVALSVLLVLGIARTSAAAFYKLDHTQTADLTLCYDDNGGALSGAGFKLYYVAEITDDFNYILTEDFEHSGVSLTTTGSVNWSARAETLYGYVLERIADGKSIAPTAFGTTDNNGKISFTGLIPGLYLLNGEPATINKTEYTPVPVLISLPYPCSDGTWDYSPTIAPEFTKRILYGIFTDDKTTYLSAIELWQDAENSDTRPDEVTVILFKNGEEYDRTVLNEENNWHCVWGELDPNASWQLAEEETPAGYNVMIEREGQTFVIISTLAGAEVSDAVDEENIDLPGTDKDLRTDVEPVPLDEQSDIENEPVPLSSAYADVTIPDAAQVSWFVPFGMCMGAVFLTMGLTLLGRERRRYEK